MEKNGRYDKKKKNRLFAGAELWFSFKMTSREKQGPYYRDPTVYQHYTGI